MTTTSVDQAPTTRRSYLVVFLVLAVFTALEVGVSYLDTLPHTVKVVALVLLAATKVSLVLLYFMHLKFDSRVFVLPLALAAVLLIPLILIFTLTPPRMGSGASAGGGATTGGTGSAAAGGAPAASTPAPGGGAAQTQSVDASLTTFAITLSPAALSAGQVTFNVSNDATDMPHELTIIKTDLPADQLPTSGGVVDTSQLDVVGSTDDLATGQSTTLTVTLESGAYVLVCNIPGHYAAGMYLAVTVGGQGGGDQGGAQPPAATPTAGAS